MIGGKLEFFSKIEISSKYFQQLSFYIPAQFEALEAENKRRRDECIQLRSILAQRSHGSPSKLSNGVNNIDQSDDDVWQESELQQAFEAQKVVNRQLEAEITALNEENNSKIADLSNEIDALRSERNQLQDILHNQIRSSDSISEDINSFSTHDNSISSQKHQNIDYLMREIKSIGAAYAEVLVSHQFN